MNTTVDPATGPLTLTLPAQRRVVSWRRVIAHTAIALLAVAGAALVGAALLLSTAALAYLVGWEWALTVTILTSCGLLYAAQRWW